MAEDKKGQLKLDGDDRENLKLVIEDMIDNVVTFNSNGGFQTEAEVVEFMASLDHASFIVHGVIYKNGIDLCAWHDDDEHEDDDEGVE